MARYSLASTSQYRKCRRLLERRGYDMAKLDKTVSLLADGEPLPPLYNDHPLKGRFKDTRECHVEGLFDWVLTYQKQSDRLILILTGTGSHADIFE